jgi:hypothetical protein
MKTTILAITLFALATLTACAPTHYIDVKPSTESLGALVNTASGNVHVYPVVKGSTVIPSKEDPTATSVSPPLGSGVYVTKDDVAAAINVSALDAIRQAGYTVSSGNEAPADVEIEVGITLKEVLGSFLRDSIPNDKKAQLLEGDLGNREDSVFVETFGNTPTGGVISEVTFKNKKTGANYTHLVSGADNTAGLGTATAGVEKAIGKAIEKYRINLVKALEAFQKGLLK